MGAPPGNEGADYYKNKIPNVATVWDNISEQVQIQSLRVQTFMQLSEVTVIVFKSVYFTLHQSFCTTQLTG